MRTIKSQTLKLFSIVFITVCAVIISSSYYFIRSSTVNIISSVYHDSLYLVEQRIYTIQKSATTIANVFAENEHVRKALLTDSIERRISLEMSAYISSMEISNSKLIEDLNIPFYVTIIGNNGFSYTNLRGKDFYDFSQIINSKWFCKQKSSSDDNVCFFTNIIDSDFLGYKTSNFVAARNVFNYSHDYIGTILIFINEKLYKEAYDSIIDENSNILLIDNSSNELINTYDNTGIKNTRYLSSDIIDFLDSPDHSSIIKKSKDSYLMTKLTSNQVGYTLLYEVSMLNIDQSINDLNVIVISLIIVCAMIYFILIIISTKKLTNPLKNLTDALSTIDITNPIPLNTKTKYKEIQDVLNSFNTMQQRISNLIASNAKKDQQLRQSEINFLLAQINPHFLNNTLFSIKCIIDMGNQEKASKMISLLTTILNNNLVTTSKDITLIKEFSLIELYVQLQQMRYGNSLTISFELPQELEQALIMKNLLQPVIENSIFHGLKDIDDGINIIVTAEKKENYLSITISDDGIGISKEKIKILLNDSNHSERHHIGLRNVNSRIRLYYGTKYVDTCIADIEILGY